MMGGADLLLTVFLGLGAIIIAMLALLGVRCFEALADQQNKDRSRIDALEITVSLLERRTRKGGAS